jgi:hypothetical protein
MLQRESRGCVVSQGIQYLVVLVELDCQDVMEHQD